MVLLIGLTGPPGSGKGAVANTLTEVVRRYGVEAEYFSLSGEIRREVEREDIQLRRDALKNTAHFFRSRMGNGVWALLSISRIEEYLATLDNTNVLVIVDGIRNPGEVRELRARFGNQFRLLSIVAPPEAIMRNLQHRGREDEPRNILENEEALQTLIKSEMGSGEPGFGHNIGACMEMSDWSPIQNDGSLTELEDKVRVLVEQYVLPVLESFDAS
jgi:dephospho-CoA kinase